jgi:hypothetical protein
VEEKAPGRGGFFSSGENPGASEEQMESFAKWKMRQIGARKSKGLRRIQKAWTVN